MKDFRDELLAHLYTHSGENIDIKFLADKYCGTETVFPLAEQDKYINCRNSINRELEELKKMGWITYYPDGGYPTSTNYGGIEGMRQFIFNTSVFVRLTMIGELGYKQSKQAEQPKTYSINVLGDNKGQIAAGDNAQQSFDKALDKPTEQKTTNSSPSKPHKRSWLEITAWIVGIASGLFVIWEFILKRFFNSP